MQDSMDTCIYRVLIIDDNPDIFDDFQSVLSGPEDTSDLDDMNAEIFGENISESFPRRTYQLDYASQGKEGLEKVRDALKSGLQYSLAFVDMRMPPGWDGLETIEHIWLVDAQIQIVICTAYSDYSWEEISSKLGATDKLLILKKPFDSIEVSQLTNALTEKWHLQKQATMKIKEMDRKIRERTSELVDINRKFLENEERFRSVVETANDAIVSINSHKKILFWNHMAETIFGYSDTEILGNPITFILPERFHELFYNGLNQLIKEPFSRSTDKAIELTGLRKDGREFPLEYSISSWASKEELYFTIIIRDITERRTHEEMLKESERKHRGIVETSPDMIFIIDAHSRKIIDINESVCSLLGCSREEIIGTSSGERVVPSQRNRYDHEFEKLGQNGNYEGEFDIQRKDGSSITVDVRGAAHGDYLYAIGRDITERKKYEAKMEYQAFYDQLTGLPNRVLFAQRLQRVNKYSTKNKCYLFAVLFMDLDRFKIINDSLGHMIGDELLIAVSGRLEACIRPDDLVARFGGDEFAVLVDNIKDTNDASFVAERILKDLLLPFELNGQEVFISASIGIALSASGYHKEEEILRDADSAMYRAKALGRSRYEIFDTAMHARAVNIMQLEADLRQAVRRHEFIVYYQPIVSLKNNMISGVEALLRWMHPERGLISPLEFIPLAEETGLISKIGEWVLRTACMQNMAWQEAGYTNLQMDVNFSARQFQKQNLPEIVRGILEETGMDAGFLNAEVTESIAMKPHSIGVLNELTAMGVQTSIDDFGTGYSSLGSLKKFPIDAIKIDKSFINDIAKDNDIETIVVAIIAMAHSLHMSVVAEGVETEEQRDFLKLHKCDEVQGYLYSPPVPEKEFTRLLEKMNKCQNSIRLEC